MNSKDISRLYRLRVLSTIWSACFLLLWSVVAWAAAPDTPTTVVQSMAQQVIQVLQTHRGNPSLQPSNNRSRILYCPM